MWPLVLPATSDICYWDCFPWLMPFTRAQIARVGDAVIRRAGIGFRKGHARRRRAFIRRKRTRPSAFRHRRAVRQRRRFMRRTRRSGMPVMRYPPLSTDKELVRVRFKCTQYFDELLLSNLPGSQAERNIIFLMSAGDVMTFSGPSGQCPDVPSFYKVIKNFSNFEVTGMRMTIWPKPRMTAISPDMGWFQRGESFSFKRELQLQMAQVNFRRGYAMETYEDAHMARVEPLFRAEKPLDPGFSWDHLQKNRRKPMFSRYVSVAYTPLLDDGTNPVTVNCSTTMVSLPGIVGTQREAQLAYVNPRVIFAVNGAEGVQTSVTWRVRKTWYIHAVRRRALGDCFIPPWARRRGTIDEAVTTQDWLAALCPPSQACPPAEPSCAPPPECPPGEWPIFSGNNPPAECWTCSAPPPQVPSAGCAEACGEPEVLCGVTLAGSTNPCPPGEIFTPVTSLANAPCTAEVTEGRYLGTCAPIV